jgi:uncharacterized protein (TIRG00374 family)
MASTESRALSKSSRTKIAVAAAIALAFVVYAVLRLSASAEWQQFRWADFWQSFRGLRGRYLLLGAAMIFSSYLLRSFRWREFVRPMKPASIGNVFVGTLVGFSAVALLGRPGEVVRPWLIARKEGLSVSSQAAAWALERVFDSLTVAGFLGLALYYAPTEAGLAHGNEALLENFRRGGLLLFAGAVAAGVAVTQFRERREFFRSMLEWLSRPLPKSVQAHLAKMLDSFAEGFGGMASLRSLLTCAALSCLVWVSIAVAFWSVFQAYGEPLASLGLSAAVLVIAATIVGSIAHLPGVGGGQQVAIALTLQQLFGVPLAMAASAALILWGQSFMMVLIPGLPLTAREGLTWQRLRGVARDEI